MIDIYIDRISPITKLLDEVFYKSSIEDMKKFYFTYTKDEKEWLLFSDYYLDNEKPNNTITFTAMPNIINILDIKNIIKSIAPKDVKHTRNVNQDFIKLINSLPILNVVFIFEPRKYYLWDSKDELIFSLYEYINIIYAYIEYWLKNEPETKDKLDCLSKSIKCFEKLLFEEKKLKLLARMYLISLLGGYYSSFIHRETKLSSLVWFSDRDSTNEICNNLIRHLFQINLIDIIKKNIQFAFTRSNSESDEWYSELVRIPDYLTGTISSFDFYNKSGYDKETHHKMLKHHFSYNIVNTFLYRFKIDDEGLRIQRMLIIEN